MLSVNRLMKEKKGFISDAIMMLKATTLCLFKVGKFDLIGIDLLLLATSILSNQDAEVCK